MVSCDTPFFLIFFGKKKIKAQIAIFELQCPLHTDESHNYIIGNYKLGGNER